MGTNALKNRAKWQDETWAQAEVAERNFLEVFQTHFLNTEFGIVKKPNVFRDVYTNIQLAPDIQRRIYNPNETWTHGFIPDFLIKNTQTGKTIYIEVKRQDGWVEGKERDAGRGNVHERSCKFFTPGLLSLLREQSNISAPNLPFWVVFQGNIARDPKRAREISCWYRGVENHFFLWSDSSDETLLIQHFDEKIRPLLS